MRAERDEALFERDGARQECDRVQDEVARQAALLDRYRVDRRVAERERDAAHAAVRECRNAWLAEQAPPGFKRVFEAACAWRDEFTPEDDGEGTWRELVDAVDAYRAQLNTPPVVSPAEMPAAPAEMAQDGRRALDAQEGTQTPENGARWADKTESDGEFTELNTHVHRYGTTTARLQLMELIDQRNLARKSRDEHLGRLESIRGEMVMAGYADESVEAINIGSSVANLIRHSRDMEIK